MIENISVELRITLVVPVRDEAKTVGALLASIEKQTFEPDEVIFVDGGSRDDTVKLLGEASKRDSRIRVIEAGEATPGRGRNVGIAAASNEWIALTDAGIRPEERWLERLVEVVKSDPETEVVYGNYEPVTESFFQRCAALAYVPPKEQKRGGRMRGPFVISCLLKRDVWREVGGFPDLRASEDLIFMEKVRAGGYKTGWAAGATVWWELAPTLVETYRKFAVYSCHNVWAGRQRCWHYGVARNYLAGLVFVVLALLHSWWWVAVPVVGAMARVCKSIWSRREGRGLVWALNPVQFMGVAVTLAAIDLATFVGWARAILQRRPPVVSPSNISRSEESNDTSPEVGITLVVPVRDEAKTVGALLASIEKQTFEPDEVIFVDGGSRDDTVKLLGEASKRDSRIRVIEAGEATPGRGRNVGIAAASNEWIALTDAGIRPEERWLERLVEVVKSDPETEVVYGNYEPVTESFFQRCAALAYVGPKQQRPSGWMRGPFTASCLLRRKVWREVGGFPDLRAGEDIIFRERVRDGGYKTGWAAGATVWWELSPTLGSSYRKFAMYSRHNVWAGRQRYWHYGVARKYLAGLPFVVLAVMHSVWWLAVPIVGAMARVGKSIWSRKEGRGLLWALNPVQFMGVAVTLAAIDLATFVGWIQALLERRERASTALAAGQPEHTR